MKSNGFFIVPYMELADVELAPVPYYVYAYILTYCRNTGECRASIPDISKAVRFCQRAVQNAINELEKGGFISCERSSGKGTIYTLQPTHHVQGSTHAPRAPHPRTKCVTTHAPRAPHKIKEIKEINNTLPIRTPAREEGIIKNDLQEVFALWLEHKKQKGKPLTTETERRLAFERLQKLSGGNTLRAIDIVKQSIANGWSSLVELPKGTPAPNDIVKAFRVHLAELQAEAAKIAAEDEEYKRKINAPGAREEITATVERIQKKFKL